MHALMCASLTLQVDTGDKIDFICKGIGAASNVTDIDMTLATIMARLGHTGRRIDVLKLDIEGSEFDVVPNLVKNGIEIGQLLIEVHWPLHRAEFSRVPGRKQTTALHTHFFGALESLGFAIAHVEFNIACGFTCVEFLWVNRRLFSPRRDS